MKFGLNFWLSGVSGFLSPTSLTGQSPLKLFSLDELVDFGGCYPHENSMLLADAKTAYSSDHTTLGSGKSVTNGDITALITPVSGSGSEGRI